MIAPQHCNKTSPVEGTEDSSRSPADYERLEKALRQSDERYRELFENANDLIYIHDLDGNFTALNKAGERISGYTRAEALKMNIADVVAPEFQSLMRRSISRQAQMEAPVMDELEIITKEGRRVSLEISARMIYEGDVPVAVQGMARDLTSRKSDQAALRESEAKYRRIAANAPGMFYEIIRRVDGSVAFPFVSDGCREIFGVEPQAVMQHPSALIGLIHPDDRKSFERSVAESAMSLQPWRWEGRFILPTGGERWVQGASRPRRQPNGDMHWDGLLMDITQSKRTEAALRESEARYRVVTETASDAIKKSEEFHNLFKLANDAILIFDPQGEIILDVNDKACETYGREREDFIGRSLKEMSEDVVRGERELDRLLVEGTYQAFESIQYRGDGTPINLVINASVIEFQGRPAILSINRDVTESKRAQEALRQSEVQLRQSQKMESIGTLAGGVAHDFNNLLTAIIGNTQLAMRGLDPQSRLAERLKEVEKASQRAADLTRQLLAFSRRQQLERRHLRLNETIADMMKMLARIIGEDIEIQLHAMPGLNTVFADPGQFEQVLMNLAVNARDAMPAGGQLIIETHNATLDETYCRQHPDAMPGAYVRVMVSDSGAGMDQELVKRIFEPFFTTKEVGKGTGLGLSMVYGIVKQHDGFIEVYSEVGTGTTFKIYLPVAKQKVNEEADPATPPLDGGTETILLAEDEESLRALAKDILEELGYTVIAVADGEEAANYYDAHRQTIDLVMLDIVMPRMGGRAAYERIHAESDVSVLFMTGYSAEMAHSHFIEEIGAPLLQKPYTIETLGRKVRDVLDAACLTAQK
jgi:PAS domain S-box-containing protein